MKQIMLFLLLLAPFIVKADGWTQKADFGGTARFGPANFSIGNKGYIGLGSDAYPSYHFVNDFWEYDPVTDTWTQKASFPGTARYTPVSFAIGTKGYTGTGWNGSLFSDLWEYDQTSNSWTQKGNFPGMSRQGVVAVVVNNKAYAGFGVNVNTQLNDFYSYNDTTDAWTQLASFSGPPRNPGFVFGINNNIYVGGGAFNTTYFTDTWEFNPSLNAWSQKANFPAAGRGSNVFFALNNKGYTGLGKNSSTEFNDFYEYDPVSNSWTGKASCTANVIEFGFSIGSKGYAGTGLSVSLAISKQFWEYTPDGLGVQEAYSDKFEISFFPNPATNQLTIENGELKIEKVELYNAVGKKIYSQIFSEASGLKYQISIDVGQLPHGIYFIILTDQAGNKVTKKVVKM